VKLADRLHNMKTLAALLPQKQKRIALETAEIYAPIAYRLGMQQVSGTLEDLAFPYLHPREYHWLLRQVKEQYKKREAYLARIKPAVESLLKTVGVKPLFIDFRAKRYSSLYKKLLRYDMDIEKIHDLVAFRIVVGTVRDCYAVLGVIHKQWRPLPGRIKDYIASPKPNGYQSLHTTVIGPEEKIMEFQIRTEAMHREAELGIAAHVLYKERRGFFRRKRATAPLEEIGWVRALREWMERFSRRGEQAGDMVDAMKVDFFKDRIFTLTPKGDVLDLPLGATPVDFAYHIHTDIGNACVGAKVNGAIVPLQAPLRSGDMVEILTQKNKRPSEGWLKFAKTTMAREHIRAALRKSAHALHPRTPVKAELRIAVEDRMGLLKDITSVIARSHLNIVSLHTSNPEGAFPIDKIVIATADRHKIETLILKLKHIKEVREVSYRLI
ncbi:MAG: TGS domain-containing protein, partial [Candidatus Liptonbacteria bacterium]|nr:TGS domain-containing protein [Candidatus Liptonbacteria bacterium]